MKLDINMAKDVLDGQRLLHGRKTSYKLRFIWKYNYQVYKARSDFHLGQT